MPTLKPELKAILDKYGINPRDTSQVWDCHGTLVLYHKAYEVIAAKENIRFDPPMALEVNGLGKSVALCVVGHMGDRSEWSVGEAAPGNNKNSYPYAMAEKRAKDRVIAKLVGLAQYVYSEDEADEFKTGDRKPVEQDNGGAGHSPSPAPSPKTGGAPTQQSGVAKGMPDPIRDLFASDSYRLDVPPLADGSGSDWETWGNRIKNVIRWAESAERLNKLVDDNKIPLGNAPRPLFETINGVYQRRLAFFSQAPNGKAA
jgi:hypothetical protein